MLRFRLHKMLDTENGRMPLDAEGVLPPGGLGVISGPSGVGKSTLLQGLAGVMPMDDEEVRFEEGCWASSEQGIRLSPRKKAASLLFQEVSLFPNMNVEGNIRFAWPKDRDPRTLDEWIEWAGLEELRKAYPDELSGGQQQRVGILRAMAAMPRLLLLDEPFAALDRANRERMLRLIDEVRRQERMSVLIASHGPLGEGVQVDRSWRLENGVLLPMRETGKVSDAPRGDQQSGYEAVRMAGVVLAGGKSRRMGRDKGLMEVNGKPMAQHSLELLRSFTPEQLIVANDPEYRRFGVPMVSDLWPEHGPLGGILTALLATDAEHILVLPCDMPYLRMELLEELMAEAGPEISIAVHQGEQEPLVGIYPRAFIEPGEAMLREGVRSVREALGRMGAEQVKEVELSPSLSSLEKDPFENWNHPPTQKVDHHEA